MLCGCSSSTTIDRLTMCSRAFGIDHPFRLIAMPCFTTQCQTAVWGRPPKEPITSVWLLAAAYCRRSWSPHHNKVECCAFNIPFVISRQQASVTSRLPTALLILRAACPQRANSSFRQIATHQPVPSSRDFDQLDHERHFARTAWVAGFSRGHP